MGKSKFYPLQTSNEVTNNPDSDSVVIRCPLNDTVLQPNQTYVCWFYNGESAEIELKAPYFSRGAFGTYALAVLIRGNLDYAGNSHHRRNLGIN